MNPLPPQPLSPLDGRYWPSVSALGEHLSEAALNRARVKVEVEWMLCLTDQELVGAKPVSEKQARSLRELVTGFGAAEIEELAKLELTTRHDVKAVEYLVRRKLSDLGLASIAELTHFACTSEDVNNLAYAMTIRDAVQEVWLPKLRAVAGALRNRAIANRAVPMLGHTHGQPATPTTVGKELAVFVHRIERIAARVEATEYFGKFNGATGTFAAHVASDPSVDWPRVCQEFVESLGLSWSPLTTQIEPHDWQSELYQTVSHANRVLHNLCTDVWTYISMGYFRQRSDPGETGSSTMPHKVNPIRFENAEGNLEVSSALLDLLAQSLVTSRLQRDLTDSTSQRNIGVAFGHSYLALDNIERGLSEIDVDRARLEADLDANWEVLAEAVQTVVRAEIAAGRSSITDPYGMLKDLTRGKRVTGAELGAFIEALDIGTDAKARLLEMTPANYIGLADQLVDLA